MPRHPLPRRIVLLMLLVAPIQTVAGDGGNAPRSPVEERATFRLADPGLAIGLVASEPNVVSPVAIAWDETGAMFVAEMIDYPAHAPSGRIKRLEDRDGDGIYEHATVYAEGLPFPNGVLPYKGGVFVTAAPNLWYFKDHDGDGRADERRVILTGFGEGNPQLRANGLTWGLDNKVYGADGRSEGEIRRPNDPPAKAVSIRRRDFRFRPDTGEVEAVAGFSQFGLPRDDWGDRFPSWNTVPWRHVVIEAEVLGRNPYLANPDSVAEVIDPGGDNRLFAIRPPQTTFNRESVATFNASCGPTIYQGDLLGNAYRGNAFVCEALTNLVHRRVLVPAGPTFAARRVESGRDFLASTDPSFRPVNLATGPDGALYVVDFYREMVEHPQFVPADQRTSVDFRRWSDRGRIWRISPRAPAATKAPRPIGTATAGLVALLSDPNGWRRDTAQRLLVERRDAKAVPALVEATRAPGPLGRVHALATLDGLGALDDAQLARSLHDPDAEVRRAAARLAVGRPGLARDLIVLADDASIRVRLQASIALGDLGDVESTRALARIAARDAGDPWVRLAALSGLRRTAWPLLRCVLEEHPGWLASPPDGAGRLMGQAASILGVGGRPDEVQQLLGRIGTGASDAGNLGRIALLWGLADGYSRAGRPPRALRSEMSGAARAIDALLDRAREIAGADAAPNVSRAQALQLLAKLRPEDVAPLIPELLGPGRPPALRSAAIRALVDVGSPDLAARVLRLWGRLGIATRPEILATLLGDPRLSASVVAALEDGAIDPRELDPVSRDLLGRLPEAALRSRASAVIARFVPADRREVLNSYQAALALPGDARRGAAVFERNCRTCHAQQGIGHRVGPDLSGIASRPAASILNDILDPNRDVTPDFVSYLLATKGGLTMSGLLVEETPTSLKLRRAGGEEESVLRSEVDEIRASGRSLMPEGFEQSIGIREMADLIAFLRSR